MRFEDARTVIDYLVSIWRQGPDSDERKTTVISFYGGEPLLNISLIKNVVKYVEDLGINRRFVFAMTSNCLLLDKHMDFLVDHEFDLLCSLDGDKEADAYRIRKDGSPSFDRVFNNIKLLQETYPEYFQNHVNFNSVLHNLNSVQQSADFIKKEFNKIPLISELNMTGINIEQREQFENKYRSLKDNFRFTENYNPALNDLFIDDPQVLDLHQYLVTHLDNNYTDYLSLLQDPPTTKTVPTSTCIPFFRKMFIKVDGKIMQCERIPHKFSIGEVKDGKVSLDIVRVAIWFNAYLDKLQKRCLVCSRKQECPICFFQMEDIDSENPVCKAFMNNSEYEQVCNIRRVYLKKHPDLYKKIMEQFVTK